MKFRIILVVPILLITGATLLASGPIGIFGIVEKVVFEPNEASAQRVQVWGAFAYADDGVSKPVGFSAPKRGYIYFSLPDGVVTKPEVARREWSDLKSVAGTGQAVAFGNYIYIGGFPGLAVDKVNTSPPRSTPPYVLRPIPGGGVQADLRVHPESEPPSSPVMYSSNAGIIKISSAGNYADMVKQLKQLLAR